MSEADAGKCPECGFLLTSREHLEGRGGIHVRKSKPAAASAGVVEETASSDSPPEPSPTPRPRRARKKGK